MADKSNEVHEYGIAEARKNLSAMARSIAEEPALYAITHRGKRVMAVMPWDMFEAIQETFEILEDEALMADLRHSIREMREGKTRPLADLKAELGL